jgi:hypothetical protein
VSVAALLRMSEVPYPGDDAKSLDAVDLQSLFHRLNNQLGIILAHAELLEAKASDDVHRSRAVQVVDAALESMNLARAIRQRVEER